jgi:hypothetical protein
MNGDGERRLHDPPLEAPAVDPTPIEDSPIQAA